MSTGRQSSDALGFQEEHTNYSFKRKQRLKGIQKPNSETIEKYWKNSLTTPLPKSKDFQTLNHKLSFAF